MLDLSDCDAPAKPICLFLDRRPCMVQTTGQDGPETSLAVSSQCAICGDVWNSWSELKLLELVPEGRLSTSKWGFQHARPIRPRK